jgi:ecotin
MKLLALSLFFIASMHASDDMKAFPQADEGMSRYVISLPAENHEELLKVEVLVGKREVLDPANRYFYGGVLEQKTVEGWGYDYFILKSLGPMAGTLMAIDPNVPKVERFITLGGDPLLHRYNSRLPLVVYVPKGVEVRYRIWRGDNTVINAPKGNRT